MSVGPLGGVLGSAAGSQLQQSRGSDSDRAAQDVGSQKRADKLGDHADSAAGIGQTEEDQGTSERDADGRKMWEGRPDDQSKEQAGDGQDDQQQQSKAKDPTGNSGTELDLTG